MEMAKKLIQLDKEMKAQEARKKLAELQERERGRGEVVKLQEKLLDMIVKEEGDLRNELKDKNLCSVEEVPNHVNKFIYEDVHEQKHEKLGEVIELRNLEVEVGCAEKEIEVVDQTPSLEVENKIVEEEIENNIVDNDRNELKVGVEVQHLNVEIVDKNIEEVVECEKLEEVVEKREENKQESKLTFGGDEKGLVVGKKVVEVLYHEYKDSYLVHGDANISLPILFQSFLQVENYWNLYQHQPWLVKFVLQYIYTYRLNEYNLSNSCHGIHNFPFDPGGAAVNHEPSYDSG